MGAELPRVIQDGDYLNFVCPGCKSRHVIAIGDGPPPRWGWNGDLVRPVFTPSVLLWWDVPANSGDVEALKRDIEAKNRDGTPIPYKEARCHSFVGCNGAAPGEIVFLPDSTHALAGQTVPLPPNLSPARSGS